MHSATRLIRCALRYTVATVSMILPLAYQGCSAPSRLPAVPQELTTKAEIPGIPGARYMLEDLDPLIDAVELSVRREDELLTRSGHTGSLPAANYLAISGGGDNGAFAAGILSGWTETGTTAGVQSSDRNQYRISHRPVCVSRSQIRSKDLRDLYLDRTGRHIQSSGVALGITLRRRSGGYGPTPEPHHDTHRRSVPGKGSPKNGRKAAGFSSARLISTRDGASSGTWGSSPRVGTRKLSSCSAESCSPRRHCPAFSRR